MTTVLVGSAVEETPPQGPSRAPRRRGQPKRSLTSTLASALWLSPAVGLVVVVLLVPFAYTVRLSFRSDGLHSHFIGLSNYQRVFSDPVLQKSLLNTFMWVVGSLLLPVVIGLVVAVMADGSRLGRFARIAIILPYALSGTAVAMVGNFLLNSNGAVNQALTSVGLKGLTQNWLLDWPLNTISAIFVSTWQTTGVSVLLFMVGLQQIPNDTIEAAALDGANGIRRFFFVILPQLRAVTVVVVGITLANALRAFDVIWVLTNGGPARTSETFALSMYRDTFLLQQPALGAAVAILLTMIVVASSWMYLRNEGGGTR